MNGQSTFRKGDVVIFQDSEDSYRRGQIDSVGNLAAVIKTRLGKYGVKLKDIYLPIRTTEYARLLKESMPVA